MSGLDYISFYEEFARRLAALTSADVEEATEPSPPISVESAGAPRSGQVGELLELEAERLRLEEELVECQQLPRDSVRENELRVALSRNMEARLAAAVQDRSSRRSGVSVFLSYAHGDEELKERFVEHLEPMRQAGLITEWHDRLITAGESWQSEIDDQLKSAEIILFLVSPAFFVSKYISSQEVAIAFERNGQGKALLIPLILRPVDWQPTKFGKLQALPKDGKPVTTWTDQDSAFLDAARGIRRIIEDRDS